MADMATEDVRPPGPRGTLGRASAGWKWFRSRPLALQVAAWAAVAVVIAVVGLAIEQQPPNNSPLASTPDNGPVSGAGGAVGGGSGSAAGAAAANPGAENGVPGVQSPTVTNAAGVEGTDVQQAAGATHVEIGAVNVGKNFRATSASLRNVFDQAMNNRGRTGLNANQLISAKCAAGHCDLSFVPDGPGAGRILEEQGPIWETLLKDPTWKSATISALPGGPDIAGRGAHGGPARAHGGPPAVVVSCTRQQVIQIGVWGVQSGPRITQICSVGHTELKGA